MCHRIEREQVGDRQQKCSRSPAHQRIILPSFESNRLLIYKP